MPPVGLETLMHRRFHEDNGGRFETNKAPSRLRSANRIAGSLRLAASLPMILTPHEQWDADAYSLGLPDAKKVDLRTGKITAQKRDELISKRTTIAPDASCSTPYLHRVLDHLCGGDLELRTFYLTILGASLFGHNADEYAYFWLGGGGSGKSTLLSAAAETLGEYSTALNRQTLEGGGSQHLTFVASLVGCRMAIVAELEGEDLSVGRFKALTGGDKIASQSYATRPD